MYDDDVPEDDPVLSGAGARLRRQSRSIDPGAVQVAVLRRRSRRLGAVALVAVLAVGVMGGALVAGRDDGGSSVEPIAGTRRPSPARVERLLASLAPQPVDPRSVRLVSSVSTFADCGALIGDLRRVGAEHVGSQGFGGFNRFQEVGANVFRTADGSFASEDASAPGAAEQGAPPTTVPTSGETVGTNVQVAGVDELDSVKAEGHLVYDLDRSGNLRITDARTLQVLATLDVTPKPEDPDHGGGSAVQELLVRDGRIALFGVQTEVSDPVEGDPSATRATTRSMTVTFVDATDPAKPVVTDRVAIEGSLVSARLVDGEIRLVTTSDMADLGFVMPTTPTSIPKALEQNRRSVAGSTAADWIPDWERDGADPQPLVPCDRVHVPDTFSGVAMTSMVTFPLGTGRFQPEGTSILAPGDTLYAGLEKVAISSNVWVDPIDRERLAFDDWKTAIHEFTFGDGGAPTYEGSGIVDGSTVGQFAFGEIGSSLAVVTSQGTPWAHDPNAAVDLTVLTPDGHGALDRTSRVRDLADGAGEVSAVRFVEGRVLVSTGVFGREVQVVDVSDPAEPRRAGHVTVSGAVEYFHPLADGRALVVGSRWDEVGSGDDRMTRTWVLVQLLDVSDADAPAIAARWERPWTSSEVGADHHAFTFWPDRKLAMFGIADTQPSGGQPNHAIVLGTDGGVTEVAAPVANQPDEVAPPCPEVPVTDPDARRAVGTGGKVLRCDDQGRREVDWPRYECSFIDNGTLAIYAPEAVGTGAFFLCSPAPLPTVSRVLVVEGRPLLLTDQTLEALDPQTFASTAIAYHPSGGRFGI